MDFRGTQCSALLSCVLHVLLDTLQKNGAWLLESKQHGCHQWSPSDCSKNIKQHTELYIYHKYHKWSSRLLYSQGFTSSEELLQITLYQRLVVWTNPTVENNYIMLGIIIQSIVINNASCPLTSFKGPILPLRTFDSALWNITSVGKPSN